MFYDGEARVINRRQPAIPGNTKPVAAMEAVDRGVAPKAGGNHQPSSSIDYLTLNGKFIMKKIIELEYKLKLSIETDNDYEGSDAINKLVIDALNHSMPVIIDAKHGLTTIEKFDYSAV